MKYLINGIPMHEGHAGWRVLRDGTNTQGGITNQLNKVPAPGRPGYSPAPYTFTEQVVVFNVRTPRERLEELLALVDSARILTRADDPTREARVVLASAIPSGNAPFDGVFDVTVTLSIYEGVWRDVAPTVFGPVTISSPTQSFQLLPGISAPVFDMDIFISGVFGEFQLTDSGGSRLKTTMAWTGAASTNGMLYVGSTGQAFLAAEADPWTPLSDRSQFIDVSGNGGFRFTPALAGGVPSSRGVNLTLTTLTQTSTTLRVRAKRSYRMN